MAYLPLVPGLVILESGVAGPSADCQVFPAGAVLSVVASPKCVTLPPFHIEDCHGKVRVDANSILDIDGLESKNSGRDRSHFGILVGLYNRECLLVRRQRWTYIYLSGIRTENGKTY